MDSTFLDIDIGRPLPRRVERPDGAPLRATVWLHGQPLGQVDVACRGGVIDRRRLARAIARGLSEPILARLIVNGLSTPGQETLDLDRLLELPAADTTVEPGQLTVVIGTDPTRPDRLERCLAALAASNVRPAAVIVLRHGAAGDPAKIERLRRGNPAGLPVRWITGPDADRAEARRRALADVGTPLVAFLDDSVRVDPHWVATVCRTFLENPQAMVVTGSVLPDGIETEASRSRAAAIAAWAWHDPFRFRSSRLRPGEAMPRPWLHAQPWGSAANMAFRTEVFARVGSFDSIAGGSADATSQHLDLWLRVLEAGLGIVREPAASVRDDGVASIDEARREIRATAAGVSASLVAAAARRPGRILGTMLVAQWYLRTAIIESIRRRGAARSLAWARFRGHLRGTLEGLVGVLRPRSRPTADAQRDAEPTGGATSPFERGRLVPIELGDSGDADATLAAARLTGEANLVASWQGRVVGAVSVVTGSRPVTLAQVRRLVVERHLDSFLTRHLGLVPEVAEFDGSRRDERANAARERARKRLVAHLDPAPGTGDVAPPVTISIMIPTRDRPADLEACLEAILAQRTGRTAEIVVVDNHPESGLTAPVVARFKGVRLVADSRKGSAYARNRGLLACRGSIVVLCDDDVVPPPGWLEALIAPFEDPTVGVVTGNILPFRLETEAERLCESACSLGRGSQPFTVDRDWFDASPLSIQGWDFGASANAAVRIEVFRNPAVGVFAESLGPGTPVGAGEDPYFFYRALKAGYRLQYVPDAWVWHKHRASFRSLRRQVYNYAKSAVGYHLMTLLEDGDRRACGSLFGGLQRYYLRRLVAATRGRADVPAWLVAFEIAGHVAGGFSFLNSEVRRRLLARDPLSAATPRPLPAEARAETSDPWALESDPTARTIHACRSTGTGRGRLPHFLVIGAQKAGTTTLDANLRKHPGIELVPNFRSHLLGWDNTKETWFFNGVGETSGVATLDDYRRLFNDNGKLQGEVCPTYDRPRALAAIAEAIPDAKLILICREPVARFESALNHMMQWHAKDPGLDDFCGWKPTRPFELNLQAEIANPRQFGLLRMGQYADAIERVLERFRPEQLLVLVAEEYRADPQETYDRIFRFLGVAPAIIDHGDAHVRKYSTRLTGPQRAWLTEHYRPHNERLFELLGREIPAWDRPWQAIQPTRSIPA